MSDCKSSPRVRANRLPPLAHQLDQCRDRAAVSLRRRFPVPMHGLHLVLLDTFSVFIAKAQPGLRVRVALLGRSTKPAGGLGEILLDSLAERVHDSQIVLRFVVSLLRGLSQPE